MLARLLTVGVLIVSPACKSRDDGADVKFIGGTVATNGLFPATVRYLTSSNGIAFCGAGKIAPRKFLTAAHCLEGVNLGSNPNITLMIGTDKAQMELVNVAIVKYDAAPIKLNGNTSQDFGHDVATFDIDQDTPQIAVAKVSTAPVAVGDPVVLSGYGCEKDGATPVPSPGSASGNLRYGVVKVASVEAFHAYFPRTNPAGLEARVCPGDSGTPAYAADGTGPYLRIVGVNSYRKIAGETPIWSAITRFDANLPEAQRAWLKTRAVVVAGQDPPAPPAPPANDPGAGGQSDQPQASPGATLVALADGGYDLLIRAKGPDDLCFEIASSPAGVAFNAVPLSDAVPALFEAPGVAQILCESSSCKPVSVVLRPNLNPPELVIKAKGPTAAYSRTIYDCGP